MRISSIWLHDSNARLVSIATPRAHTRVVHHEGQLGVVRKCRERNEIRDIHESTLSDISEILCTSLYSNCTALEVSFLHTRDVFKF